MVQPKMSPMLLHQLDFWRVANHLALLGFVQHSSQSSQGAVGVRSRARKFQLLSTIACNLIYSQFRDRCRLQQPPAITVEFFGLLFQPPTVHPVEKAVSKLTQCDGLTWNWISVFHHRSQLEACHFGSPNRLRLLS